MSGAVSPVDDALARAGELRAFDRRLEVTDRPGQVLAAIRDYMGGLDRMPCDVNTASFAFVRLEWLLNALDASIARTPDEPILQRVLAGVGEAVQRHQSALSETLDVNSSDARAARDVFRLELTYLSSVED